MVDLGAPLSVATWLTIPNSEKILSLSSVASKALYLRSKKARKGLALCFHVPIPVSNSTWGRMDESQTSPPLPGPVQKETNNESRPGGGAGARRGGGPGRRDTAPGGDGRARGGGGRH